MRLDRAWLHVDSHLAGVVRRSLPIGGRGHGPRRGDERIAVRHRVDELAWGTRPSCSTPSNRSSYRSPHGRWTGGGELLGAAGSSGSSLAAGWRFFRDPGAERMVLFVKGDNALAKRASTGRSGSGPIGGWPTWAGRPGAAPPPPFRLARNGPGFARNVLRDIGLARALRGSTPIHVAHLQWLRRRIESCSRGC